METRNAEEAARTPETLARAFHEDAMFTYILPDPGKRERVLPWFFGRVAELGRRHGRVTETGDGAAAAIWLAPGSTDLGPAAFARSGLALAPVRFGPAAFRRFLALTGRFEKARDSVVGEPFWHLFVLGVHPDNQRSGLGGQAMAPVLSEADDAGQACYLETTEESNLPFYERHGFEVAAAESPSGMPRFWSMVRRP